MEFFNEFYVLDLVMSEDGQRTAGVVAYELATGEIHVFRAKSVVFATGGFGKVYKTTSNAHTLTGDGIGIVYRNGLPLEDMEFYQFHPTGLAGLGVLLTRAPAARRHPAQQGRRAVHGALRTHHQDLAPRDMVARAMVQEVREGRGGTGLRLRLPRPHTFRRTDRDETPGHHRVRPYLPGVDPITELVPVFPTAHYAMGGIPPTSRPRSQRDNDTVVPGLYAAGECACVSVHGANRLAPTRCWTSMSSAGGRDRRR